MLKIRPLSGALLIVITLLVSMVNTRYVKADPPPAGNDVLVYEADPKGANYTFRGLRTVNEDGTGNFALVDKFNVNSTSPPYVKHASKPQFSPDRSKIHFYGTDSSTMHTINPDGTGLVNHGTGFGIMSPDGTKTAWLGPTYYHPVDQTYYPSIRIRNINGTVIDDLHLPQPGNPQEVKWTSDSQSVVFSLRQNAPVGQNAHCYIWIAKIDIDETNFAKLTPDDCLMDLSPDVNPVDDRIVWNSGVDANHEKYRNLKTMNIDGSNIQTIVSLPLNHLIEDSAWSPSGDKIAARYSDGTTYIDIRIISDTGTFIRDIEVGDTHWIDWASKKYEVAPLDSGEAVYAVKDGGLRIVKSDGTGDRQLVSNTDAPNASSPQLSTDRKKVYYISGGSGNLHSIDVDGRNRTDLGFTVSNFSMSPDGAKLAMIGSSHFDTADYESYAKIKVMDADGTDPVDIDLPEAGVPSQVTWNQDGSGLVFQFKQRNDNEEWDDCLVWIAKIDVDETDFAKLSGNDCVEDSNPAVNPDDGKIAWNAGLDAVKVMDGDGSNITALAPEVGTTITYLGRPVWSASGVELAVIHKDSAQGSAQRVGFVDATTGQVTASGPDAASNVRSIDW